MSSVLRLPFLNALRSGNGCSFGTWLMLSSAHTARVVASAGWDWIIVDCEHGNIGDSDMHDSVNAIAACGVSPVVRIRGTDATLIKRALDCGAHGIMVPMVSLPEEAEAVVAASRFPPMGLRGQGSPFSGFSLGVTIPEYLKIANDSLLVIIQIENKAGLENVEKIAAVKGVDMLFIGPNDLAMSLLGYAPAKYTEKVFLDALDRIRLAARKAGIKVGILAPDGVKGKTFRDDYDMVGCGGDVKALQGWMAGALKDARS